MEWLDVYTPQHERSGRRIRRDEAVTGEDRLLVVHVCLFDRENRLLLQQRQPWKDRYPGCWDLSAGGFARSGEDSPGAALRELEEELGLALPREALRFLFTAPFSYVLDDFYLACTDLRPEDLRLQAEEVSRVRWAAWPETARLLADGSFVDYDPELIARVYRAAAQGKKGR